MRFKKNFSRFTALQGYVKIFNCYRSVIENPKKVSENIYNAQIEVCDKLREAWLHSQIPSCSGDLYFLEYLNTGLQTLVVDMERKCTGKLNSTRRISITSLLD